MHNTLTIGTYLATIGGLRGNVIAAVELPNRDEYVAVFERSDRDSNVAYSTHRLFWHDGSATDASGWIAESGHYDMAREAAIANMVERTMV